MQTMTEMPYQPIVYAIPKEHFKALLDFMKATTDFQPEMYEKLAALESRVLTKEDWNVLMEALNGWSNLMGQEVTSAANSIVPRVQALLQENKERISKARINTNNLFFIKSTSYFLTMPFREIT